MKHLNLLLIFIPVSLASDYFNVDARLTFAATCLAIVPLAVLISDATEQISIYTGSKIGGLLNATMGNIPELFIGLFAVKAGLYKLMLASMAGSIIGNLMFVLGMSILCGGIIYSTQTFDKAVARSNFSLLFFAAISLIVPLAFKLTHAGSARLDHALIVISFTIALILLIIYLTGLIFSLFQQRNLFLGHDHNNNNDNNNGKQSKWSLSFAISVLAITIFFVALESELLITTVKSVITSLNLPEIFIGIIIIPILGNVAEHASAIMMAVRNKVDISLEIAIGSSVQIAMLVTPILILYSFTLANPLIYVYDPFVVVAVITAIFLSLYVVQDGKTFWLEGALLVFSYIIFCVMFFYDD